MSYYQRKYILEFDDIIQGEFNDYKLEIFKKYDSTSTDNNVYITATASEAFDKGDPVFINSTGNAILAKASGSMPAIGVAYEDIPYGQTGDILIKGSMSYAFITPNVAYYVGENGGLSTSVPTTVIQKIGYQSGYTDFILFDQEVTLTGTGSPVKLTYNLVDDDMLSTFRSSYLDISFYKENLSDDFSELFGAENDSFEVTLKKDNVLFWKGWIGSQLFSEPFISPPYPIKLRAYDGLHLLKNIPYFDSLDVFQATSNLFNDRYGYHNIVDVVEKCIYNTGVLNDIYYLINIQNSGISPQLFTVRTRIHHQTFLKGESNSMNMEEVLQMILKSLGATIYQRDGNWCIIKISDLTLELNPTVLKRSNWQTYSSNPTATNYITTDQANSIVNNVSRNVNLFQIDGKGFSTMTVQYPLKEVTIEHEFDHNMVTSTTIDSVRDLGADDPSGTYLFTEWEPIGSNIQEAVVLRENEVLSEAKDLAKSFIEADLSASGVNVNYCDPYLSYPVSHNCLIDSSKITGVRAEAKARPLGRSLVDQESMFLSFTPKLSYVDGTTEQYGFGSSKNFRTSMIDKRILRINAEAFEHKNTVAVGIISFQIVDHSSDVSWRIEVTKNKRPFFSSQDYTTPANTPTDSIRYVFGDGDNLGTLVPLETFTLIEADYEVFFYVVTGSPFTFPANFLWTLRLYDTPTTSSYSDLWQSQANQLSETTRNFVWVESNNTSPDTFSPVEGGNIGSTPPSTGVQDAAANTFKKPFDCDNTYYFPTRVKTTGINDWIEYSITGTQNWRNDISFLTVNMTLFGAAKAFSSNGNEINTPYTDTYDVSYTDVKLLPLVTQNTFVPKKQEYKITQSGNFSNKLTKKVEIGSGLFNTGSNRYITFDTESGNNARKSWDTFRNTRGTGYGVQNATIQHLLAACYMQLYRISVRRLDTTHYGNYKYGDRLQPIVNGSIETLNGSQGRFFPMNVVMDLKMARTKFSGDDLMDNTGTNWQSTLTKTIRWIGDKGISETETLS